MVRSVSGHVKNSFREERVGHQQLEVGHGILHSPFLHHDLGHVQRGKRCVESAVEFVSVPCLRVRQPAELLGIAKAKLYLKPGPVKVQYFLTRERSVSREEQLALLVGHDPDDEAHLALERLGIGYQRVGNAWQSVNGDGKHP